MCGHTNNVWQCLFSPGSPTECAVKVLDFCQIGKWEKGYQCNLHFEFSILWEKNIFSDVQGPFGFLLLWAICSSNSIPFLKNIVYCPFSSISRNSLKVREISPLSVLWATDIFPHLSFAFWLCLWNMCVLLFAMRSFWFLAVELVNHFLDGLWIWSHRKAFFTSRFLLVLWWFHFKSLNLCPICVFFLIYGMKCGSNLTFFQMATQLSQSHWLELSFLPLLIWEAAFIMY